MLKRKLFCCMVILVLLSVTACAGGDTNDVCKGIHISATEQEDSWEEDGHRILIKKDGVILSLVAESGIERISNHSSWGKPIAGNCKCRERINKGSRHRSIFKPG